MKTILTAVIFLIFVISGSGQKPADIIEKSHDAVQISSFEAISTLTITDSRGNERIRQNTMASKTFNDDTEKRIIKFISPAEVKGTGILIYDYENRPDDMWIYLPALRKTRRIVSREKSNSFMGSEFSNADMTAPSLEDFEYKLLGSEEIGEVMCWKIESIPVNLEKEDEYGYSRSVRWIGKNDYIARRSEYFDYDNALIKRIEAVEFKLLDSSAGKFMVTEMVAENFENGRSSRMKMDQIDITETDESYFTVTYLER
ncbi:MAG: outer membrane lipoprotein-sorting protein [Bacteroidales bacterium]